DALPILTRLQAALAGHYIIQRELGRGGMATVYLAHDLKHDRAAAIKVVDPEVSSAIGVERFLREIRLAAQLQHPHILPLYDSGQASGFLYYVMPFVAGESLRERLEREKQLRLDEALRITREVAEALDYAHRYGVVHRDIKPANILLANDQAMIADFGIARAFAAAGEDKLTQTGLAVGTPGYMSPEQASGSTRLDGRSDIYSLGCVSYEMLAGSPPFTGSTPQAILARHLSDPVPPLRTVRRSVPASVEQAILRALEKVPADRFATVTQFADALEAPAAARPHLRPWLGAGVAAVAAAGAGGPGAAGGPRRGGRRRGGGGHGVGRGPLPARGGVAHRRFSQGVRGVVRRDPRRLVRAGRHGEAREQLGQIRGGLRGAGRAAAVRERGSGRPGRESDRHKLVSSPPGVRAGARRDRTLGPSGSGLRLRSRDPLRSAVRSGLSVV